MAKINKEVNDNRNNNRQAVKMPAKNESGFRNKIFGDTDWIEEAC